METYLDQCLGWTREESFDAPPGRSIVSGTSMTLRSTTRHILPQFLRLLTIAAVGFLALGVAAQSPHHKGHHPPKKMEREQVEDLEQQWTEAMLKSDTSALEKLLSDDYLGVSINGELLTKTQQLDRLKNRQLTLLKLQTSDSKIKLIGQIAIVTSLAEIDGMNEGKPLQGAFRYTKVYQRLPSGLWQITSFEATRVRPTDRPGSQRAAIDPGHS